MHICATATKKRRRHWRLRLGFRLFRPRLEWKSFDCEEMHRDSHFRYSPPTPERLLFPCSCVENAFRLAQRPAVRLDDVTTQRARRIKIISVQFRLGKCTYEWLSRYFLPQAVRSRRIYVDGESDTQATNHRVWRRPFNK